MGKDLHEGFAEVRALYEEASDVLGYDVAALSFEGPEGELNQTERTQPCLLAASAAALKALELRGIRPEAVAGHSLGEYTALVAAGVISFGDALRVTEMRGRLMQEAVPEGKGLMAAVLGLEREKVKEICRAVKSGYAAPANFNCPGQIVVSGEKGAVEEAMKLADEAGARRVVPLAVSVPSHCALMEETSERLGEYLSRGDGIGLHEPLIPVVTNADARFLSTAEDIRDALLRQLKGPVYWEDSIAAMRDRGFDTFVEVGPGKVLSGLIKRVSRDLRVLNVEDTASLEKTLGELKK
jgi:[acyl-carrier-protein] S-malonyltransferase